MSLDLRKAQTTYFVQHSQFMSRDSNPEHPNTKQIIAITSRCLMMSYLSRLLVTLVFGWMDGFLEILSYYIHNTKYLHCIILCGGFMLFGYCEVCLGSINISNLTYMSKILYFCIRPFVTCRWVWIVLCQFSLKPACIANMRWMSLMGWMNGWMDTYTHIHTYMIAYIHTYIIWLYSQIRALSSPVGVS
jgi:hypothetical protein